MTDFARVAPIELSVETAVEPSVGAAPGGSEISPVHDGWDEAGLDADARDDHAGYWAGHLEDLRDILAG